MQFSKERVIQALAAKGITTTCPRCGQKTTWELVDGFVHFDVSADSQTHEIGGPAFPAVALGCNHCGFLSFHVAQLLGLDVAPGQPSPSSPQE
ncbi:hypothetical protein [Nocardioides sp.]|uniref:hypothetical protein n=1 Tax=Nocardioides sp. TaxID=35761 RepID=UPI0037844506